MSRYIDADRIEEVIRNDVPLKYFMTSSYNGAIRNGLKIAEILNDKIPTADVEEVKHGQWLKEDDTLVKISAVKNEAYKEFAERLKSYLLLNKKGEMSVISFENVDTLLKEMVGDEE